jgi:hypothetical protein
MTLYGLAEHSWFVCIRYSLQYRIFLVGIEEWRNEWGNGGMGEWNEKEDIRRIIN